MSKKRSNREGVLTMKIDYAARNAEIYRLYAEEGMRQKNIAVIYGLSESRVKAIIAEQERKKNAY